MDASALGSRSRFSAVVPAHNEQATIAGVVEPLLAHALIDEVIVVDDGSTDGTGALARAAGARVITLLGQLRARRKPCRAAWPRRATNSSSSATPT